MSELSDIKPKVSYRSIILCFAMAALCLLSLHPELLGLWSTAFTRIAAVIFASIACFLMAHQVSMAGFRIFDKPSIASPWGVAVLALFCFSFWNWRSGDLYFDVAAFICAFGMVALWIERNIITRMEKEFLGPEQLFGAGSGKRSRIKALEYNEFDRIEVSQGEYLPVDAELTSDEVRVSCWMLSGEQDERVFKRGDVVLQGSRMISSNADFEVRRPYLESFYLKKLQLIRSALSQLHSVERGPARLSMILSWALLFISSASFLYWFVLRDDFHLAVEHAVSVLCVGVPLLFYRVVVLGIYTAVIDLGKMGVLFRSLSSFKKADELTGIAFDKTGSLTESNMIVSGIKTIENYSHQQLLALASSLESSSSHPIGRAITEKAKEEGIKSFRVESLELAEGKGLKAQVEKEGKTRTVVIGNSAWLLESGLEATDFPDDLKWELEGTGDTGVWVAEDSQVVGILFLSNPLRSDVPEEIRLLKDEGYDLGLITGDAENVADNIKKTLKLDFAHFGVAPEEKVTILNRMSEKKKKGIDFVHPRFAYIGDAYSEDLALERAHLGFAFGVRNEVIDSPADVLVLSNRLDRVRTSLQYFKRLRKRSEVLGAIILIYHLLLVPVAGGMYFLEFSWSLNPLVGLVIAIFFSSVLLGLSVRKLQD